MTISTQTTRSTTMGPGSTVTYGFRITAATDLNVYRIASNGVSTLLTYPTEYSVSGVGNAAGGSVTLTTALVSGESAVAVRALPTTQPTSFRALGTFRPESHEDALDRLTMIAQQQDDAIERSLRLPASRDPASYTLELTPETGKALVWQSSTQIGNATIDTNAVTVPGGGRSVATTSAYLLNNAIFNPLDFGGAGDGVTDDSDAVQAALDAAGAIAAVAGSARVELKALHAVSPQATIGGGPSGSYCVKVPSGVMVVGNGPSTGLVSTTDGATVVLMQGSADGSHVTNAGLRSMAIAGGDSTANGMGRGVYMMRADYCSVIDCDISGTIIGVQCDRPTGDTNQNLAPIIAHNRIHDTYWSGSLQTGSGTGIFVALTTGARIIGNTCWNIAEHGVYVCDDTLDLAIIGNDLRPLNASNQNCCVQVYTSEAVPNINRLTITGNTCVGGKWGILVSTVNGKIADLTVGQNTVKGQTTNGIVCSNVTDVSITGNQVSLVSAGAGIEVDAGTRATITGNGVRSCGTSGIMLFGTTYGTVMGNVACNNDQAGSTNYGIRIASGSTHARVIGNVASDDQGSPTQAYGVQADSDCDFVYVAGNTVRGNKTAAMSIAAANAVVRDNDGWNPVGPSSPSVTASPMTYTNGASPATLYVKGGTVSSITTGGVTLATATDKAIPLAPNQAVVITYSVAPTLALDVQ